MKIHIEKREPNKQGKRSLRLVYYLGTTTDPQTGKRIRQRRREPLDLYVYDDPRSLQQRQHNKVALKIAETMRTKRLNEAVSDGQFVAELSQLPVNFFDYYQKQLSSKKHLSTSSYAVWMSALKHLQHYHGAHNLPFHHITLDFLEAFKAFLQTQSVTRFGKPLSANTASAYFNKIREVLRQAYLDGLVTSDFSKQLHQIKPMTPERTYLTQEEIQSLYQTDCRYPNLKKAFLFSCLTGFKWSDIQSIYWSHLQIHHEKYYLHRLDPTQSNTSEIALPPQAIELLGPIQSQHKKIFQGLKYSSWYNTSLLEWAKKAGIIKHVTFHTARHTFAMIQLIHGTDIYTLSRILGHSELKTTQVYADLLAAQHPKTLFSIPDVVALKPSRSNQ